LGNLLEKKYIFFNSLLKLSHDKTMNMKTITQTISVLLLVFGLNFFCGCETNADKNRKSELLYQWVQLKNEISMKKYELESQELIGNRDAMQRAKIEMLRLKSKRDSIDRVLTEILSGDDLKNFNEKKRQEATMNNIQKNL